MVKGSTGFKGLKVLKVGCDGNSGAVGGPRVWWQLPRSGRAQGVVATSLLTSLLTSLSLSLCLSLSPSLLFFSFSLAQLSQRDPN